MDTLECLSSVIAASALDKSARVWDALTGTQIGDPLWHERAVVKAIFNGDGSRIATASLDGTARIWGAGEMPPLRHRDAVRDVAFSRDGTRIATASQDRTARLWDAASGAPLGEPFTHDEPVQSVAFSADGTRILTASLDGTARIWNVGPTGEAPAWFIEFAEQFCGWKLDADGKATRIPSRVMAKVGAGDDAWTRLRDELAAPK